MTYYAINNFITGVQDLCATEEEAAEIAARNKAQFLEQESYRFTIARVVIDGKNTTWMATDLDTDPDDGLYQVFNTITGQHEEVSTKVAAIARRSEIQKEFLSSLYPTDWVEISDADYKRRTSPNITTIPITSL